MKKLILWLQSVRRTTWMLVGFVSGAILLFGLTAYFLFIYERVPVDYIAEEFCQCATSHNIATDSARIAKEGFRYVAKLDDCFGKAFSTYDDPLAYEEELDYVRILRDKITEKCPDKLQNVFRQ